MSPQIPEDKLEDLDDFFSLYKSIQDTETVYPAIINGEFREVVTKGSTTFLPFIEKFVREIALSKKKKKNKISNLEEYLEGAKRKDFVDKHITSIRAFLRSFSSKKIYSPYVELFFEVSKEIYGFYSDEGKFDFTYVDNDIARFEALCRKIGDEVTGKKFQRKVYSRTEAFSRGYRSAEAYVNELFEKYSRLLVLRIDFGFPSKEIKSRHHIEIDDAHNYLKKFLNNKRAKALYSTVVGYIWRMEHGEEKGYHFHFIFFLDGSKSHKDEYIAQQIGLDWHNVTDSLGCFHNCNASKIKYKRLGIGMISHDETQMRENLLYVLKYMHKQDQTLNEKISKKARTWGRGEMPKTRTTLVGRPRKKTENG